MGFCFPEKSKSLREELSKYRDLLILDGVPADKFETLTSFMESQAFHLEVCPHVQWFLALNQDVFVNSVSLHR